MQHIIDDIISSWIDKYEKIQQLQQLFTQENILCFTDFDDTLSTNDCVFYTKVKLLKKQNKATQEHFLRILKDFKINKNFPKNMWKIVIISRNNIEFIKIFLAQYQEHLKSYDIEIVAGVGTTWDFQFDSKEKLLFLPPQSRFIWDSFEEQELQEYNLFYNVDSFDWCKKHYILMKKIIIVLLFIFKWY